MTWLLNKVGGWLGAAGAVILLLFGAWAKGRREGKAAMQEEQERHRAEALARKRKMDSEIDELAPADLDQHLARWLRKEDGR